MTRSKVKIEYITNDQNRNTSFNKRKKGLIKKMDELTTLCGVEGCAIVFDQHDQEPKVWPSALGVQHVLAKFRLLPDLQQATNMENLESFTCERINKAKEKLRKMKQENREKEMTHMMFKCLVGEGPSNMDLADLNEIRSFADKKIKEIGSRIDALKKEREILAQANNTNN